MGATQGDRTDYPPAADERATLTKFLQYERLTVHAKCLGLAHANAAKTPLPSSPAMSVAGLVSHLVARDPHSLPLTNTTGPASTTA